MGGLVLKGVRLKALDKLTESSIIFFKKFAFNKVEQKISCCRESTIETRRGTSLCRSRSEKLRKSLFQIF